MTNFRHEKRKAIEAGRSHDNSHLEKFNPIDKNQRLYLNVPYRQKDEAKALGAKWDAEEKKWYIAKYIHTHDFDKWM